MTTTRPVENHRCVDDDVVVRPYEAADRPAVRRICYETGYLGGSPAWMWTDVESWADMFSGYYTDREPESAWVAEVDGVVGGYLLGAVDATKAWNPAGVAGGHLLRRGLAFRSGTRRLVWRFVADAVVGLVTGRIKPKELDFHDDRWPAHLHIDLLPATRGRGVGARLVTTWMERLRALGVAGCHLQTMAENTGAIAFFEAVGFRRHGEPLLLPGYRTPDGGRHHLQTMVRELG